jgi:hypothetical protein
MGSLLVIGKGLSQCSLEEFEKWPMGAVEDEGKYCYYAGHVDSDMENAV